MGSMEANPSILKRNFFIFGHNISHTLSPTLHNTGFRELALPHHYAIHQTESVDASVESIINANDFGGASVTFPHKLQIGKLLDAVTPCAQKIGAVNTVIVEEDPEKRYRRLVGDNTDWHGIRRCIERSGISNLRSSTALVLGAGGAARAACYAIQELGITQLLVVNRTISKAAEMVEQFPALDCQVFETLEDAVSTKRERDGLDRLPLRVIVACVPADDFGEEKIPAGLFGAEKGVLVEMAYRPQVTGMMKTASRYPGWTMFKGVDVLEEQAYAQFKLWTGKEAPVEAMKAAMQAKINER
ncbi:shikimate-5-dehydrogenase [Colletotrichum abscissum]|uniref:Shikimate-5-dehydrogenase n=1 Tax=Colletotrichum abscissum TaxID=1671311 RepID=A0A9P9XD21_9PEZI|nr:shikimate-5-dehydrogenase [Colletotrichum abscissum]KAI3548946.1 shikimate-5-dehydrogenase [Colletotrichum abscissum]KAK1492323.1 shikimate-5-dehydrogenase [Colletotrichum abscissum]